MNKVTPMSIYLRNLFVVIVLLPGCLFAQTFDITHYGAVPGGSINNAPAIQRAIDACAGKGGGRVYVPAGVFVTGTIHLKSNIDLYLEAGATLLGSPRLKDYDSYTLPEYGLNYYGMFYTHDAVNVSITGLGTIDGNNKVYFDFAHAKKIDTASSQYTRQRENYRKVDSGIGDGPVVPLDRPHQMLIFSHCNNVHIQQVNLMNSPFWTLHLVDCDGVKISDIRLFSGMLTPNGDGIDVTSCENVIITGCDIRTGDDAVVITGFNHHFEIPGFTMSRHPSGNIIVSNCNLQSASSAVRIGFLDQNTVRNIHVSHCNITNSTRGIGIFLRDEGSLENISFEDMTIETRMRTGDWWGNGEPIHISAVRGKENVKLGVIRNVEFRNITCTGENGLIFYGSAESILKDIRMDNISFTVLASPLNKTAGGNIDLRGCLEPREALFASDIPGIYARYVDGLTIHNFRLNWSSGVTEPYFTDGIKLDHYSGVVISGFKGGAAPGSTAGKAIAFSNGDGAVVDGLKMQP
jgi:polygalacturonase